MNRSTHAIGSIYYNRNQEYFPEKFQFIDHASDLYQLYKQPQKIAYLDKKFLQLKRKIVKQEYTTVAAWIKNNSPQLIHVHFGTTAAHFVPLLKKFDLPFIVSFYGYDYRKALNDKPGLASKYKYIFNNAKNILVEEYGGIKHLKSLGCKASKIELLRLGVNSNLIEFTPISDSSMPLSFIQVANFVEKKGQIDLVQAVFKYRSQLKGKVKFTFLGDFKSKYGEEVREFIDTNELNNFFTFLEPIPYIEIHKVIAKYDVFFHFSKHAKDGDCEGGAPTILLDAQAVGIPILSSNHCDIPRYLSDYSRQFLVKEGEIDDIYRLISECIAGKLDFHKMINEGREHVENYFDITQNGQKLEDLYKRVVNR